LPPCPVDALVGASKYLHAVIVERCTGCELCLAPCPVDCIEMRAGPAPSPGQAALNRGRFDAHEERRERRARERGEQLAAIKAAAPRVLAPSS
jgi:electron transport complex protein RnfB